MSEPAAPLDGGGAARASESVARRFTRTMRACTSPFGMLTDPPLVLGATGVLVLVAAALGRWVVPDAGVLLYALPALPFAVAVVVALALLGARARVVGWLAAQPFPVENVNGLLNGIAAELRVRFAAEVPSRQAIDQALETVSPDCFALEIGEDEPVVEVRIGVADGKLNPARSNYLRYCRVQALVAALVALSQRYPIRDVWIA